MQAGVEVRVFYDDMGSIGFINTDFVKKMEQIGIHCRVFNPFMPGLNVFLNNRDHRKITVIDGKVAFTGGYNLANEYFNYTNPYGQWKDTGIRLEGDAVQSLTATFLEIVVESMKDGMHIYDDPVGVLTNNPPFPGQMFALNNYAGVSRKQPESTFAGVLELDPYSRGMGGMGIPGDLSSQSRFVKVAFTKLNAISGDGENESVSQFFHILGSVDQQRGCCEVSEGAYEITIYTSCCNTTKGIYYYTTYDNHQITAVDMYAENLDSDKLIRYPIILNGEIRWHNK